MVIKNSTQHLKHQEGTAIYVNKYLDPFERIDLNINSLECESTWIEIKNKIKNENIVIASIYRHPQL